MSGRIRIPSLSIRTAFLLIFTLLLATPLALFWAWPVSRAMQNELDQVRGRHLLLAENLGAALERYHRDVVSTFEYFAARKANDVQTGEANKLLQNLHFRHICIADLSTGQVIFGFGEILAKCPEQISSKKLIFFKSIAIEGKTVLSGVLPGPQGEPLIFMVRQAKGQLAVGALRTGYFVELGKAISFGVRGHAAIVDQLGRVLAHPFPDWIAAMKDISKVSAVRRILAGETGVETFFSPAFKDDMIAGFTSVKGPGWGVMIPQPLSELRQTASAIQLSAISVFAIGMLIAVLVSLFSAIPILRPLSAVIRGAKRMEDGETNVRLSVSNRLVPREFRTLVSSFNSMAESVTSAQMAMEESAKSFRDLVEGSIQGVCIHSDSKILFVNPAMAHIFGYDDSDAVLAVGNIRALLATDEHERLAGYTLARNAGEDVPDIYEAKGVKKDGSTIWVEFRVTPVLWHGLSALQSVIVDITDRKKAEKELIHHRDHLQDMVDEATRELNLRAAELREALAKEKELNELQRQFVAITSHEFRTPLAIIDSAAQLLKRGAGSLKPGETLDKVERIRGAVQRMTQLMEKTLTAAKMEDGQISVNIRSCNIERIIKDVCALQQQMAKSHVISCHLSDLPETIKADSSALEQVLANLLSNAVKFAPDACDIEINASRDGDDVVISVRDQGLGIDDADLPRIFSRYFRAKTAAGIAGTGIGLNLVKALIEMHGGSVGVESKAGEGSNFTVRLPIGGPARAESDDTIAA